MPIIPKDQNNHMKVVCKVKEQRMLNVLRAKFHCLLTTHIESCRCFTRRISFILFSFILKSILTTPYLMPDHLSSYRIYYSLNSGNVKYIFEILMILFAFNFLGFSDKDYINDIIKIRHIIVSQIACLYLILKIVDVTWKH